MEAKNGLSTLRVSTINVQATSLPNEKKNGLVQIENIYEPHIDG